MKTVTQSFGHFSVRRCGKCLKGDQKQQDKLAQLHAGELSACWKEVEEKGGICRIEYIKDRTDTIIGAKVVREEE